MFEKKIQRRATWWINVYRARMLQGRKFQIACMHSGGHARRPSWARWKCKHASSHAPFRAPKKIPDCMHACTPASIWHMPPIFVHAQTHVRAQKFWENSKFMHAEALVRAQKFKFWENSDCFRLMHACTQLSFVSLTLRPFVQWEFRGKHFNDADWWTPQNRRTEARTKTNLLCPDLC